MCLANPKNNKNFEFTTACSAVCTVRKLQRTRSCSLALTNAHCYCPCLCRLFSMRMRDAARCFRSHSWLSRTAAAAALLPFSALYCILHLNLPSVNLTHTEASSCIYVSMSLCAQSNSGTVYNYLHSPLPTSPAYYPHTNTHTVIHISVCLPLRLLFNHIVFEMCNFIRCLT